MGETTGSHTLLQRTKPARRSTTAGLEYEEFGECSKTPQQHMPPESRFRDTPPTDIDLRAWMNAVSRPAGARTVLGQAKSHWCCLVLFGRNSPRSKGAIASASAPCSRGACPRHLLRARRRVRRVNLHRCRAVTVPKSRRRSAPALRHPTAASPGSVASRAVEPTASRRHGGLVPNERLLYRSPRGMARWVRREDVTGSSQLGVQSALLSERLGRQPRSPTR